MISSYPVGWPSSIHRNLRQGWVQSVLDSRKLVDIVSKHVLDSRGQGTLRDVKHGADSGNSRAGLNRIVISSLRLSAMPGTLRYHHVVLSGQMLNTPDDQFLSPPPSPREGLRRQGCVLGRRESCWYKRSGIMS